VILGRVDAFFGLAAADSGTDYPRPTLSVRGDYAVPHPFSAEDKVLLLAGDGVIADDATLLVPLLDDLNDAPRSVAFVPGAERACAAVREFLRHGSVEDLREWQDLATGSATG